MKRILILSGFALWMMSCNSNSAGTGGNPAEDSVVPAAGGHSADKGSGRNSGGSSDPMNGGGPQQLNNRLQTGDSLAIAPNTDSAANKRTPVGRNIGDSGGLRHQ
ncbi:MAG TPA: hypothetical protein VM871_01645 [Flavisolibacter sp.]|jgi:hypothetical protein|nr:hypothetical protein [Flavisolibacter sp.]